MQPEATGSQQLLKVINRMALVRHVCAHPGLSRADLASAVGLTKSTVSLLVRELVNEGWLVEREVIATGDLGRRPTPLFIDPARLVLLGAEVGIESVRVVATSLTGEVRASDIASYGRHRTAEACLASLAATLVKVTQQLEARQQVLGIGVGLPGGVNEARGVLHFAPNLGWRDLPFAAWLGEHLRGTALEGVPLFIQNEADVAALGEREFNPSPAADPLLYVSINQGLGAGVIVGDRLLTGNRGFAGEVGHMVLQLGGPRCSCGRRGCAEALITTRAMLGTGDGGVTALRSLSEVRAHLLDEDPETLRTVASAGRYLGVLLQNLATAYDPGCIVLGGAALELGDPFVAPALDTLADYAAAAHLPAPTVRTSRFGVNAVAVGAAALARYRLTRPAVPLADSGASLNTPFQEAA
ncbi:ROK family transcriptional regulator [Roseateles cellulosilyticus]|uniref:ROK family transcriptional regulator n=1 Tax=Pelomonas cellulosilytica TaxID=2906762 RepID=A0ABS8Y212_9BURK|nr:ROK family transcriptional regulator [Pelomonas sp. P8]MCE4556971.1 ROK family transcriptional regulator [Pelomonas sp. P8]